MTDREFLIENVALTYYNYFNVLEPRYVMSSAFHICRQLAKTMTKKELISWQARLEATIDGRLPPYYPLRDKT